MISLPAFFIAMRYARSGQRNSFVAFINGFSIAGITLGLMALITVVSVMNGFEAQLRQRVLGVVPHLLVKTEVEPSNILAQSNVLGIMPYQEAQAVVQSPSALRGVMIQGTEPAKMRALSIVSDHMLVGSFDMSPNTYQVIIGRSLANQLNATVGDSLRLLVAGKTIYTPFGRVPSQRLVTIAGIFDLRSQVDDTVVYMHINDLMRLQRKKQAKPNEWRVFLHNAFDFAELEQGFKSKGVETSSWHARQGTLFDAVKMEKNLMFIMLLLIIAVAAFNVISALVMVVSEKQRDIAILLTQGMRTSQIMQVFLLNGLSNGVKGAIFGSIAGAVVLLAINPVLGWLNADIALSADGRALPIVIDFAQISFVILLSLGLCLLSSIYPAIRATRIQPARALQND